MSLPQGYSVGKVLFLLVLNDFGSNCTIVTLGSRLVRITGILSLFAGFVMIIGVLLFQVPYDQAYVTWFTVSFSSVSISIGISAFESHKGNLDNQ